jgi:hypothetical protein
MFKTIHEMARKLDGVRGLMLADKHYPGNADPVERALKGFDKLYQWCKLYKGADFAAAMLEQRNAVWKQALTYEVACAEGENTFVPHKMLREMIAYFVDYLRDRASELSAAEAKGGGAGRKRKSRKRQSAKPRPVTPAQAEAVQIVGECKGNMSEAARRLGKDPKTVRQNYRAGLRNVGMSAAVLNQKPKTQNLPHDRRGQVIISDEK